LFSKRKREGKEKVGRFCASPSSLRERERKGKKGHGPNAPPLKDWDKYLVGEKKKEEKKGKKGGEGQAHFFSRGGDYPSNRLRTVARRERKKGKKKGKGKGGGWNALSDVSILSEAPIRRSAASGKRVEKRKKGKGRRSGGVLLSYLKISGTVLNLLRRGEKRDGKEETYRLLSYNPEDSPTGPTSSGRGERKQKKKTSRSFPASLPSGHPRHSWLGEKKKKEGGKKRGQATTSFTKRGPTPATERLARRMKGGREKGGKKKKKTGSDHRTRIADIH